MNLQSAPNINDEPLVSVVIPAYNSAAYIAEAIESALGQDYPALEVIVIDDGSTDQTVSIVSKYGDRVKLVAQKNKGSGAARNLGIRAASGKYIAFLDADDVWWKGKIRYQVEALAQTRYKMAYSRFIWWHPDAAGNHPSADNEFAADENPNISTAKIVTGSPYAELLLDCIVWTSTVLVEKSALEMVGVFDESLRKGQDYDLWLRLSRQIEMLGLEKPTALYRIHQASITSSVKDVNYEYLILSRAIERWGETGPDGRMPPNGMVSARLARSSFGHGYAHFKHGDPEISVSSFRQSITHSRGNPKTVMLCLAAFIKSKLTPR